jgi:hypothetical protein
MLHRKTEMAFIPNNPASSGKYGISNIQTLKKDVSTMSGTITKGSQVQIVGIGDRGYEIKDIDSGVVFIECGYDLFEPKV